MAIENRDGPVQNDGIPTKSIIDRSREGVSNISDIVTKKTGSAYTAGKEELETLGNNVSQGFNSVGGVVKEFLSADDPNMTSGSAADVGKSFSFPLSNRLDRSTIIRFAKYKRNSPKDAPTEDTTDTIQLPLPITIPDNSSIKTSGSYDLDILGNLNINSENVFDIDQMQSGVSDFLNYIKNASSNGVDTAAISGIRGMALKTKSKNYEIGAGIIRNPHTTTFFDGVNIRTFTLSWRLSARSQKESDMIQDIIDTLKYRSHPDTDLKGIALDYPDLAYVSFVGDVSPYLPKYNRCFISSVQSDSSGGGSSGMQFFTSGAPLMREFAVSFNEIEIITRQDLRKP